MTPASQPDQFAAVAGQVATVWQHTLNLSGTVPWDAGFVSLGGDSLLLYSIMDEVEGAFEVELDVDAVIADLTVNGMAKAVIAAGGASGAGGAGGAGGGR